MSMSYDGVTPFRRVAVIGAIANPNVGDEIILEENIRHIEDMFGENCSIYVFSKDASFTSVNTAGRNFVAVDYLNRITKECGYTLDRIREKHEELLSYEVGSRSNLTYEEIHEILSKVDVLHIIGGGYLNGVWPDMLEEVRVATKLAKQYGARVLATGIGVFPVTNDAVDVLREILESCDVVDFRDDSFTTVEPKDALASIEDRIQLTTDDAIFYGKTAPAEWAARIPAEIRQAAEGRYLNISVHSCEETKDANTLSLLVEWVKTLVTQGSVDHVNYLAFSSDEALQFAALQETDGLASDKFRVVNLVGLPLYASWYVIAHASCNVGTRYHQAVFSLANNVPCLSISINPYYDYKIQGIHGTYASNSYCWITEVSLERLSVFWARLTDIQRELIAHEDEAAIRYSRKMAALCKVYAGEDANSDTLFHRVMTSRPVRVSVIVPIYNMECYLAQCLDSVLNQTLQEIEVICIDDGSTDRSASLLYEYAWKDRRVKILPQKNRGVAAARNVGLKAATGEFVFFIDPDDWLASPNALSILYWSAKEHGVKAACGKFIEVTGGGEGKVNSAWVGCQSGYEMYKEGLVKYRDYQFDYGWIRFVYDRLTLIANDLWFPDRKFYEDPVWFTKVMDTIGCFWATQTPVYCYRTSKKTGVMPYDRVVDLVHGLADVLEFAQNRGYHTLWSLTYGRITFDFVSAVASHLTGTNCGEELEEALQRLNDAIVAGGGDGRIERMFILAQADRNIAAARKEGFRAGLKDVRGSVTYKVGDAICYLPRKAKNTVRDSKKIKKALKKGKNLAKKLLKR